MIACGLAADRVIVTVAALPSVTVGSSTEIVGPSSSVIVTVAAATEIVAFVGLERLTVNVSSASSVVSPVIGTENDSEVEPASNVSVPEADV